MFFLNNISELQSRFGRLNEDFRSYVLLQLRQAKFELVEFAAAHRAKILFKVLSFCVLMLVSLFTSLFAALYLNQAMDSQHLGFALVAACWVVVWITCYLMRHTLIRYIQNRYLAKNIPS